MRKKQIAVCRKGKKYSAHPTSISANVRKGAYPLPGYGRSESAAPLRRVYALQACRPGAALRFEQVLTRWVQHNRVHHKGSTAAKYQFLLERHILPGLGAFPLRGLTATVINSFLKEKLDSGRVNGTGGLSASYVRTMAVIIQSALQFAQDEHLFGGLNSKIYKPALVRNDKLALTPSEQRTLEAFAVQNPDPAGTAVMLALHTGMRIGEICALSWENVDLERKMIYVRHTVTRVREDTGRPGKTKMVIGDPKTISSRRDIPITSVLLRFLRRLRERSAGAYVASQCRGFVSPRTMEYRYHKLLDACGVRKVNFHALRHTFATRCIEVGVDIKSLSEILGHANATITLNTYVHSSMQRKRQQLEKLAETLSTPDNQDRTAPF